MGRQGASAGQAKRAIEVMLALCSAESMLGRGVALAPEQPGIEPAAGLLGHGLGDEAALVEAPAQPAEWMQGDGQQ
ncbi:hypothetical protein RJ45_01840 [Photobacterium gaetbulicola]|uniref:Uncharacterized protein n=1 Tax=Photobacterium gaetbulicola TaxID=1295392 RepID=A0A0B9G9L7_9GAMM|nr:hypothetical protein [Photobacterium gaetbulicola]KHT65269.1 hypothetical protein RJ45_01840 [Photobacterium gaetbulicola]